MALEAVIHKRAEIPNPHASHLLNKQIHAAAQKLLPGAGVPVDI